MSVLPARFALLASAALASLVLGGAAQARRSPQTVGAPAAGESVAKPGDAIDFAADQLTTSQDNQVVTATGSVVLVRDKYRLTAQTVVYDRRTGQVEARGQVIVTDPSNTRLFGDRVQLTESLRDGAIDNMLIVLKDGGRLAARSGRRIGGVSHLNYAVYTPCHVTDDKHEGCGKTPIWEIRAVRVTHDPARNRVSYKDAEFDLLGLRLFYLPGFSHPASEERNASGLLNPEVGYDASLGLRLSVPYYLALGDRQDLTITPTLFSAENPTLSLQYRKLFDAGPIQIEAIGTDARLLNASGQNNATVNRGDQFRGYFAANGQLDHGDGWRSTFSTRLTTDDTFLSRYALSYEDRLRSFYRLEHFSDDLYVSVGGWAFDGLRVTDRGGRSPIALPLVDLLWRPQDEFLGGKFSVTANALAISRTQGQNVQRLSTEGRWTGGGITDLGQRITVTALLRGDVYHTTNPDQADLPIYAGDRGVRARAIPAAALDVDWPLSGPAFGGVQTITPRVQIVASGPGANRGIPNEDARAVELTDINLFSINRFPGFDRWEGGTRITYGGKYVLSHTGWEFSAEGGQSARFDRKTDLFPPGTGLASPLSDFVGRATLRYGQFVEITNRLRLDKDTLAIRRNETDVTLGSTKDYLTVGYVRLNRGIAIEDLENHEELRLGGRAQLTRHWSIFGSTIVDLTTRTIDPIATPTEDGFAPIRHRVGFLYRDECFEFGLSWRRDYQQNIDVRAGDSFILTFALKNLGR